jgi:predicted O-methyltransferase YrrM|tara:strand:+ start:540 stop:1265 length:726 start_codon:yes stop_codon:yes gene_type:complete
MSDFTTEDKNEILIGEGKRKFGFHPVYFIRTLSSVNHFKDANIRKILRELSFNHSKIQTRMSGDDIGNMLNFMKNTQDVTGNIIELGTWLGGFTCLMAKYLNMIESDKHIITCDSFEGMPEYTNKEWKTAGLLKVDIELVKDKFKQFSVDDRITIVKGFIEKTLPTLHDKTFSFALIDTAAYDSLKFALEFIYPRLSKNGIITFDDYLKPKQEFASAKAIDEFCKKYELKVNVLPYPHIIK